MQYKPVCFILALLVLAASACFEAPESNDTPRPEILVDSRCFYMGLTPFPWDFSIQAVVDTNQGIARHGDIISHHLEQGVPWSEALAGEPFHPTMMEDWNGRKAMAEGKKIFLSLTPLNEGRNGKDLYRGEKDDMPLPPAFENLALNHPDVQTAYLNYCLRAITHFSPDYLAITIEANELFHNAPQLWPDFIELYQNTYTGIKAQYPDLPVCGTISLHNLTNPGWTDREEQQKQITDFLAYNDFAGISYYPFMAGQSERPLETFDWLRSFTDKPIAITETGYPAETIELPTYQVTITGNTGLQDTYIHTLLERANQDGYIFVIHYLYRDYDALWEKIKGFSPEAFVVWKDCGFLDGQGRPRPAFDTWKAYLKARTP
jgi:hypothetical protein